MWRPRLRCTPRPVEMSCGLRTARSAVSPPPRAQRVVGRGERCSEVGGGGCFSSFSLAEERAERPPPPTPPRRSRREGRRSTGRGARQRAPPASAEIRPASCRRRSGQSAAPSDRRGLLPAAPADARAATSRGPRTIDGSGRAAACPASVGERVRMRGGTAQEVSRCTGSSRGSGQTITSPRLRKGGPTPHGAKRRVRGPP